MTDENTRAPLLKVFAFALALRWAYALALFIAMGPPGLLGPDSIAYLANAESFSAKFAAGALSGWDWLGPQLDTMPLFAWAITLTALVAGSWTALAWILIQGAIDAGTCLFVYGIAGSLAPRFALPAAIAASINPTQIVLAGLLYPDTLFVFFVAVMLFASVRWLRAPRWRWALLLGVALAGAALSRILVVPFVPFLLVFLLLGALRSRIARQPVAQLACAGLILALAVAPIVARNVDQYGTIALTPQGGAHLLFWVVPLAKEASDGTPIAKTIDAMRARVNARYPTDTGNPFESSRRYAEIGRPALQELGFAAAAKAWMIGAAINLGAPAIILSPPVLQLPRTGFYATPGASSFEKILNFLFRSDNAVYAWILSAGLAGVAAIRLMQLCGLFAALREQGAIPLLFLLGLWVGYILAINGPVASPKYRLPIEPPLAVLTGAGFRLLRDRRRRADQRATLARYHE